MATYLEESEKWEEKHGHFLILPKESRPDTMPPRPEPPYELSLWYQCKDHDALLVSGGILDQPYFTWICVQACGAAISEHEYKKQKIAEVNERLRKH